MIADRLKILMGNMSAREFATKLGKSPSTVHEYLKGRMLPLDFAVHICGCFGCSLEWLATGDESTRGVTSTIPEPLQAYENELLPPDEQDLLKRYRKLDERHRQNILEMIAGYEALSEGEVVTKTAVGGSRVNGSRKS